jgi:hypothetical protein
MNPYFNYVIAQERAAELMRSAKQGRLARVTREWSSQSTRDPV